MAKSNKGKILRNGHYVPKRPYHMSEELRAKLESPVEEWYSEKTGKSYSSEARMRTAEKASERMKGVWKIKKIEEKYLPMAWEDIPGEVRMWPHGNTDNFTILGAIFIGIQHHDWSELKSGTLSKANSIYGLNNGLADGRTLKDFINAVFRINFDEVDADDLPDIEEI